MQESTTFLLGEKKKVVVRVRSTTGDPFEVSSAKYTLISDNETEASGPCEVSPLNEQEVLVSALIQPLKPNTQYELTYTYDILPETLIHKMWIQVI